MDKKEQVPLAGRCVTTYDATLVNRTLFSRNHLRTAGHMVELARVAESECDRPNQDILDKHRAYVISAIISSVAYLEASINEVFKNAADKKDHYFKDIDDLNRNLLKELWIGEDEDRASAVEKSGIIAKYQVALTCLGRKRFNPGESPCQKAILAVKLRNALVHAKPVDSTDKPEIEGQLRGEQFAPNPLAGENHPFFPDMCLGHGCAAWALRACRAFVEEFCDRTGLCCPSAPDRS